MKRRLYVDMDGTLAVFFMVDTLETIYEPGYFRNLPPQKNVVEAIRLLVKNEPDIEVSILSAYLTDSPYALKEKQEWLDEHLPEVPAEDRIFVPCGKDKKDFIPDLSEDDFLLDDYTKNLNSWDPPGTGIKILNGINHTRGTWQGEQIRFDLPPEDIAERIYLFMMKRLAIQIEAFFSEYNSPPFGYAQGIEGQENREQWIATIQKALINGEGWITFEIKTVMDNPNKSLECKEKAAQLLNQVEELSPEPENRCDSEREGMGIEHMNLPQKKENLNQEIVKPSERKSEPRRR